MKMSAKTMAEYGSVLGVTSGLKTTSNAGNGGTTTVNQTTPDAMNGGSELVLHQGNADNTATTAAGGTGSTALVARKDIDGGLLALTKKAPPKVPKPEWHAPWKLKSVVSGHLGWVRCLAFEPGNQWFVTGATGNLILLLICEYYSQLM